MSIHLQDKCSETGRIKGQISRTIAKTHWNLRLNFLVKTNSYCTFFIWPLYHFLIGFLFVGFFILFCVSIFFIFFPELAVITCKDFYHTYIRFSVETNWLILVYCANYIFNVHTLLLWSCNSVIVCSVGFIIGRIFDAFSTRIRYYAVKAKSVCL